MSWWFLFIAGIFEIGWPLGFKLSQSSGMRVSGLSLAILSMALSGYFLWLAQKTIPIGTSYVIWTSMGAAGTFLIGISFFGDSGSLMRYVGFLLILTGVIVLKLAS